MSAQVNVNDRLHWVVITAHTKFGNGNLIEVIEWRNMWWHMRQKWSWYFTYRAALLQVKHPRAYVEMKWGNSPAEGNQLLTSMRNRAIRKRGQITNMENRIALARKHWCSLFPIEDDDTFKKVSAKLERIRAELAALESEIETAGGSASTNDKNK